MIEATTKPAEWHHKPNGWKGACPVCNCPADYAVKEHRATVRGEGYARRFVFRVRRDDGWSIRNVGASWGRPTVDEREGLIEKAARAFAYGRTISSICEELGVPTGTISRWRLAHGPCWDKGYQSAMGDIVDVVREQAGTDAVLTDPDQFLRLAIKADKWATDKGEELFSQAGDELTLTGFYRSYYFPTCTVDLAKSTQGIHQVVLKRWRLLTGDPPLSEITVPMLAKWRDCLMKCRGQSPGSKMSIVTVRNFLRYVHMFLLKAGPPGYKNLDAADLIPRVPWVKSPRADLPAPKIVSVESISSVYNATNTIMQPEIPGLNAADWWQSLIAVAFNTGLRRRTLFELRWDYVDFDKRVINVPPKRLKSRRFQVVRLNETAVEHLRRIEGDRELVFPWPYCKEYFDRLFHKLQYEAGLPGKAHFGLHNLRKTFGTHIAQESPQAASMALGHAGMDVTIKRYINHDAIVHPAVDRLEQPEAFTVKGVTTS